MSSKLHQEAKCADELRETPEAKESALGELVNNLKGNPKMSAIEFERDFLVHYLRVNKYDVKKSLKHIQNYVDLWNKEGFLFKGIPDDYFSSKISTSFCALLPERCPDGCPVILFRIGKWDANEMKFTDILKIIAATHLQLFRDPMTQINGIKTIYDFKGTSFQHLRNILNDKLYLINHIPMNCIPARHRDVHIINETIVLNTVWKLVKPFLSQKLRNRVHFLSDPKRLCDYVPPSMLPAEYGGEIQNIDSQDWIRRINREQKNFTIGGQPNFY
ncbi:Alpha-tocopherol transfer protein-like [Argiope bruennichi]|uniref:Alpha-tocopherol transfer protein-like n=1 Tax=Argiope bruennichi TaxID=94029 RepID=A0A8T0E9B1_ARGBR|nr:Alpha-tocopherol transfer protein-like [Argiope bruennichi]